MKVAFQMEHMNETKRGGTHTLFLMEEACRRGYEVYHFHPETLSLDNKGVHANLARVIVDQSKESYYTLDKPALASLEDFDVVLFRQDPPWDMAYVTSTYILERLKQRGVTLVNDPFWIRNMPDKISIFDFAQYLPPTLISRNEIEIADFFAAHKDVVIKPLYGFHGHGIIRSSKVKDALVELKNHKEPLIFQPFIPEIAQGNKRVVFFDGEVVGAINVVPSEEDFRVYRDSVDQKYELNAHEKKMCADIGAVLKERGIIFVGIDIIGKYLVEINAGSVGSIYRLDALYKENFSAKLWDVIGKRRARRG